MTDVKLRISPPWITYYNELVQMFGKDEDINISYDNIKKEVAIRVDNVDKANILSYLLPYVIDYGNEHLNISVVPSNDSIEINEDLVSKMNAKEMFDALFADNPVYKFSHTVDYAFITNAITYVVFDRQVVQFFNDNLNDPYGNITTLYQEIAKDIFCEERLPGVFFATERAESLGKPLGEWP